MKGRIGLFSLAAICASFFLSCKKGEGDPFISLSSRKARLANEWKLKSCVLEYNSYSQTGKPIDEILDIANERYTFSKTDSSGTSLYNGLFTMILTMDKKGGFTLSEKLNSLSFKGSGTWDFVLGVGSAKSKENVYLKLTETQENEIDEAAIFISGNTEIKLRIRTLREKRLVLVSETNAQLNTNGKNILLRAEYVFEP